MAPFLHMFQCLRDLVRRTTGAIVLNVVSHFASAACGYLLIILSALNVMADWYSPSTLHLATQIISCLVPQSRLLLLLLVGLAAINLLTEVVNFLPTATPLPLQLPHLDAQQPILLLEAVDLLVTVDGTTDLLFMHILHFLLHIFDHALEPDALVQHRLVCLLHLIVFKF